MHDTRMRGEGPYVWKVYLRRIGSDRSDTPPADSLLVRTQRNNESAARGQAQIALDTEGMRKYYPAEVEKYFPLGEKR